VDKVVYLIYLFLTTTTLVLVLRALWSYTMERPVQLRALGFMVLFLAGLATTYFYVRGRQPDMLGVARAEFAKAPDAAVRIAAAWPSDDPGFIEGAQIAADEINASAPSFRTTDGEEIKFTVEIAPFAYDRSSAQTLGRQVIRDTQILGVVGHSDAVSAIRGTASYNASALVHFIPTVRKTTLTENPFSGTFQLVADDNVVANHIADFIWETGHKNITIVAARDEYTHQLYIYLQNALALNVLGDDSDPDAPRAQITDDVPVATYLTYADAGLVYPELVTSLKEQNSDFIVIFDEDPSAVELLTEMLRRRLELPVMILPKVASLYPEIEKNVYNGVDKAQKDLIHVVDLNDALIRANSTDAATYRQALLEDYGYDAVMLMSEMWERSDTLVPTVAATYLRALPDWSFAGQSIDFLPRGGIAEPRVVIRRLTEIFPDAAAVTEE
jgi:ABC-type branched-subunit amino acid transport system substrate-binding protein